MRHDEELKLCLMVSGVFSLAIFITLALCILDEYRR
jgi:hypothetical protein